MSLLEHKGLRKAESFSAVRFPNQELKECRFCCELKIKYISANNVFIFKPLTVIHCKSIMVTFQNLPHFKVSHLSACPGVYHHPIAGRVSGQRASVNIFREDARLMVQPRNVFKHNHPLLLEFAQEEHTQIHVPGLPAHALTIQEITHPTINHYSCHRQFHW